jgi:hypothetical protein
MNLIPSVLSDRVWKSFYSRVDAKAPLILGYSSSEKREAQLYMEGFALRLAFMNPAEIESLLDFQVSTYFQSDWEEFIPIVNKIISSHRHWFPAGCQVEIDISTYIKSKKGDQVVPYERTKEDQLTLAQSVLAIMILHKINVLSFSEDRKPIQDFIRALTGYRHRDIGDRIAKFNDEYDFLLQGSKRKNMEDYKKVRLLFKKLENKQCIQFIDNQLIKIGKMPK